MAQRYRIIGRFQKERQIVEFEINCESNRLKVKVESLPDTGRELTNKLNL